MPYQIIKSILFDFSDYVHCGLSVDDIDDIFDRVVKKYGKCFIKPVSGMLVYEVKTLLTKDEDIAIIGKELTEQLDIALVEKTENESIEHFRRN